MYQDVIDFWFNEIDQSQWWKKDDSFDQEIRRRFGELHTKATCCELYQWRETAHGRLAEIIVLDQFSRNMHRDSALAFASDPLALALAQEAVLNKVDRELSITERSFLYMPYMHSESLAIHDVALELFKGLGVESSYDFEVKHRNIIEEFGRYPHRNDVLGRSSTEKELAFLKTPNSSF